MVEPIHLSRRGLVAAGLAAPLLSGFRTDPLAGVPVYSESVQIGMAAADGSVQVVARLCRYPDSGRAWTWVQVLTPQGFFSSFDHHAPCGPGRTAHEGTAVRYSVEGPTVLAATRDGPRLTPTACDMRIEGRLTATGAPREGEGWIPFSAHIQLDPQRRYAGLLPDRSEVFGPGRLTLELNGERHEADGFGQFHEQPQTTPRFSQPYGYASLWGPRTGITIVASARGGGGYRAGDSGTTEYRAVTFGSQPDEPRRIDLSAGSGPDLTLVAHPRIRQSIPIFNGMWKGAFVEAAAADETFFGVIVDFA